MHALSLWLRACVPAPMAAGRRERFFSSVGACLGLLCTAQVSVACLGTANPWFIAPMGASAVLLFAVPASPLAQPWSILGGNMLSASFGVLCAQLIPNPGLAAGVAVALAIAGMFRLRCLHPPSGAVALTAVLGGPAITQLGFRYVLAPVALNSALLLLAALVFNNLVHRRYPHMPHEHSNPHRTGDPLPSERLGFTRADLDAALEAYGELLDVSRDDLEEILVAAELRAYRRRFGDVRCAHVMARDVVCVRPQTTLQEAWALLARHTVKALPVTDEAQRLLGIVTLHDFFVEHGAQAERPWSHFEGTRRVADVMSTPVRVARPAQAIVDLVPLFSDGGLHHLPVVDEDEKVVGMLTQSDLVAALYRHGLEHPQAA